MMDEIPERKSRIQPCLIILLFVFVGTSVVLAIWLALVLDSRDSRAEGTPPDAIPYNDSDSQEWKYPPTPAIDAGDKGLEYSVGIISDHDQNSTSFGKNWISHLSIGKLYVSYNKASPRDSKVEFEIVHNRTVQSEYNVKGRGMELSDLAYFNGDLYSCDDRTGIVYKLLMGGKEVVPVPWVVLADGNGKTSKAFKCEWLCVKDSSLWVGGFGADWVNATGHVQHQNPKFVKKISAKGEVEHLDWIQNFDRLSQALNITAPGYILHESGGWSEKLKKWVFLPRRESDQVYNQVRDERMGTNKMLIASEDFQEIQVRLVGEVQPTRGFSTFKWIPGTDDQLIVAIKSEEFAELIASYVLVFDMQGNVITPETLVSQYKYEGIEFI